MVTRIMAQRIMQLWGQVWALYLLIKLFKAPGELEALFLPHKDHLAILLVRLHLARIFKEKKVQVVQAQALMNKREEGKWNQI